MGPPVAVSYDRSSWLRVTASQHRAVRFTSRLAHMALRSEVVKAEEEAAAAYGTGPGAVRFISGTWSPHIALERRLAAFHRKILR